MSFNKFLNGRKKEEKKLAEEKSIRLTSIINEIQELCGKRQVNYYEMMDILTNMLNGLNIRVAGIMRGQNVKINKYLKLLKENNIKFEEDDRNKSK